MRIAYIAPYQGPGLLKVRPSMLNLGLAANVKMEMVAELLQANGHEIEFFSQGEVVERKFKFYPGFEEPTKFHPDIPTKYASALPIRFINGFWSTFWTLRLFKQRHENAPFDLVIIYNLKQAQTACALSAMRMSLPVILEYEDDALVDLDGKEVTGVHYMGQMKEVLSKVDGCIGVSPHILTRVPKTVPQILLRGVVSENVRQLPKTPTTERKKWVVFSGTHSVAKGLEPLVHAWMKLDLPGWELHIGGQGQKTKLLEKMAETNKSIVFHGLLNREQNANLLGQAAIGINPHDVSKTPGNVFAFKIIEYLAAGTHVITTHMGELEPELEVGITYMPDNSTETIARTLQRVIQEKEYVRTATDAARERYGPSYVAESLNRLVDQVSRQYVQGEIASAAVNR